MHRFKLLLSLSLAFAFLASANAQAPTQPQPAQAQPGRVYTDADYAQAEKFMPYSTNPLVLHVVRSPTWMPDGRMWYRDTGTQGNTITLVDPVAGTKRPAFDQAKLAAALQPFSASSTPIDPYHLPVYELLFTDSDKAVTLTAFGKRLTCDLAASAGCRPLDQARPSIEDSPGHARGGEVLSPDGTRAAFIRDWNLWLRNTATNKESQLTTDGVKDFGYATDNAGWTHSDNPILVWSPDSKRIATFQQDQRKTGEEYLTDVTYGHPTLTILKYPLVGDKDITMIERVVLNLNKEGDKAKIVRLKMPPDQHRSTLCDDVSCRGGTGWDDVEWAADSNTLAFVSTSRDHKQEWFRLANPGNGDVREVFYEAAPKFFESGNDKVNWHYLSASNQLLWFSERSGWGHLYLYDIPPSGQATLKAQLTSGDWNVTQVLSIDQKSHALYFLGVGKEPGEDPYYPMYYRVSLDGAGSGSAPTLLTPERAAHAITPSPDSRFFVDTFSTPTEPQISVIRDTTGKVVVDVAREDITRLKATGWQPLVQIQVKARDGQTDLYGFLFRPTNFTTEGHYPIVNYVYPGPQTGSCGARTFTPSHGDLQSLAELGFIVVCIDGMGTNYRSKAFHEAYYADLGDDTIPDQVAGMKQLAERYPWIDLAHSGIWGHSGGGNATASAMFHFPDFFSVGIAESGNHDNRDYEDDWAEKWAGLLVKNPDGTSNYDAQANQAYAKNLKGHLLLAHGTMDDNVPTSNTLLVVDALIKANKDFDLILFPNAAHGYGSAAQYMTRRRWDYFVRNLAGATPPREYLMRSPADIRRANANAGPDANLDMPEDVDWTITDPEPLP